MDALESLSKDRLESMLAAAIEARHRLLTRPTSASSSTGRSATYAQRLADADAYISRLNAALSAKSGTAPARGPIYVTRCR